MAGMDGMAWDGRGWQGMADSDTALHNHSRAATGWNRVVNFSDTASAFLAMDGLPLAPPDGFLFGCPVCFAVVRHSHKNRAHCFEGGSKRHQTHSEDGALLHASCPRSRSFLMASDESCTAMYRFSALGFDVSMTSDLDYFFECRS